MQHGRTRDCSLTQAVYQNSSLWRLRHMSRSTGPSLPMGESLSLVPLSSLRSHPIQFDADVALPSTSRPFLLFLSQIIFLLSWIYAPLLPTALTHVRQIWAWAGRSDEMQRDWWAWRGSWLGGPIWRWSVGWLRAAKSYIATSEERGASRSEVFGVPGRTVPVLSALALLLISIASGETQTRTKPPSETN